ncbi:SDR family NAD(P)-dependent oxidoreductase [Uliginosibacterium sp. sgz301328]|uniref:SDR family NAD(P)-dependent oxidoreductase n=1 Tax=Uliginosibacterium sp. sgz301328 TaxID=3243764 RepID=UPI00359CD874
MDLQLAGDRILIVGASEGIGYATARALAAEGARVTIAARRADAIAAAAQRIANDTGTPVVAEVADVTDADSVANLLQRIESLDALVLATGGSRRASFESLTDADWLANYELNVLGGVRTVRAALPLLRQGRSPRVLFFGGAAARMPYPNQVVSNVHKAGLLALTKTLAAELAPDGIRVNALCPGRTWTRLWQDRAETLARDEGTTVDAIVHRFSEEILVGRFAKAEEIADVAAFLLSPRSSYIVGQSINVDGGIARGLL